MERHRLFARIALAALTVVTALALGRLFSTSGWMLPLLGAALIPHLMGALADVRRIHGAVLALAWFIGLVLFDAWVAVWDSTIVGIPTFDTIRRLGEALGDGGIVLREGIPPVEATAAVVAVAVVGVWLVAANADWLAFRADAPLGALVPSLILMVAMVTLERDSGQVFIAGAYAVAAAAFLATTGRDRMERRRAWLHASRAGSRRSWITSALVIAGGAAVAAMIVAPILPGSDAEAIVDVRGLGSDDDAIRTDNPLVRLSGRLNQNPPVNLFTVESDVARYWRLVALEEFDGNEWKLDGTALSGDSVTTELNRGVRGDRALLNQTYDIISLEGRFFPAAYNPISTDLTDVSVVPEARAIVAGENTKGTQYTLTSELPPSEPSADQINATDAPVPELLQPLLELPGDFPDLAVSTAQQVAGNESTPWAKAKELEAYFSQNGDFEYTLEADYGAGSDAIAQFLETKEGFCEQFAAAYAAMARSLGIPARVAVGFTPGRQSGTVFTVSTREAHAWAEVYMEGLGWMPMEPTPAGNLPGQTPSGEIQNQPPQEPGNEPATTTTRAPVPGETVPTTTVPADRGDSVTAPAAEPTELPFFIKVLIAVVVIVIVLALLATAIIMVKKRRREARRTATDPALAIGGAWDEALERLREAGYTPAPSLTPDEVAERAPAPTDTASSPALRALADEYVVTVYGPRAPDTDAVDRAWAAVALLDEELDAAATTRDRLVRRLDPRVLFPKR